MTRWRLGEAQIEALIDARELQVLVARRRPPKRGVVEETDRHALGCVHGCSRNGEQRSERHEYKTDCFQHGRVPFLRFPGQRDGSEVL